MVRKKNQMWMYYNIIGANEATCKLCQRTIKTSGNTSNMIKHLRLRHPNYTGNVSHIKEFISKESEQIKKIKIEKIEQPKSEYHEPASSIEPDASYPEADTVEADIIEYAPMRESEESIGNVYEIENMLVDEHNTYLKTSDENVNTGVEQSRVNKQLVHLVSVDKHSLDIVEGEGFKKFFNTLCPLYKLPKVAELKAEQTRCYEQQLLRTREQLAEQSSLSLSCNVWTHKLTYSNHLDITVHYLEETQVRSRFLTTIDLQDNYTVGDIVKCLKNTCVKFNILKERIACVVADNSVSLGNAVKVFIGADRYLQCFARYLHAILEGITAMDSFRTLLQKIRGIVQYFQVNAHYAYLLDTEQLENPLVLLADNEDNAFSFYYMIERYVKLATAVHKILLNQAHISITPPTKAEIETLKAIVKILTPLESVIREITVDRFMPLSKVLPIISTLSAQMKRFKNNTNKLAAQIWHFITNKLELHLGKFESNALTAMTCLLDPRFKNIPFQDTVVASDYITQMCAQYREYSAEQLQVPQTFDFWSQYRALTQEKAKRKLSTSSDDDVDNEVVKFFSSDVSALKTDAATQWQDMRASYPFLYQKVRELLHIPATSIPAWSLFTERSIEELAAKQRLHRTQLDQTFFLSDCNEKDWSC